MCFNETTIHDLRVKSIKLENKVPLSVLGRYLFNSNLRNHNVKNFANLAINGFSIKLQRIWQAKNKCFWWYPNQLFRCSSSFIVRLSSPRMINHVNCRIHHFVLWSDWIDYLFGYIVLLCVENTKISKALERNSPFSLFYKWLYHYK